MATLDFTKAASGVDMTDPNLVSFGSAYGAGSPTAFSYLTPGGHRVLVKGAGMTFDAAGRPTGGTATSIEIDVKNDGYPDLTITGVSVAAATLDDGPASFWRFLEGADVILGPESAQGAGNGIFRIVGDGVAARNGATGGGDIIQTGDRIGNFMGDVWTVGALAAVDYRGGDDEMLGLATNAVQYAYGDAGLVYGGSRLTGGADTIVIQSTSKYAYAAGDAAQVWSLNSELVTVVGGDDYMTAGAYFQGELSGDVAYQEANSLVQGGDDTINGGYLGEFISGDVGNMKGAPSIVTRLIGGDDTIDGGGGADVIAGDLRLNTAPGVTITGGDDTINGGGGDDTISGDVYSAYPGVNSITGGGDVIRGGGGNDKIYGDSTDNNQNAVGVGGADRLYGEDGDDRIFGHGGGDILDGGAGVDELWGGDGADWLSGGGAGDRIAGDKGDDQIDGGAGADQMYGGAGDDTFYVNDSGDVVHEIANFGADTVWSFTAAFALAANVENLLYNGVGAFAGIGNALANTIAGGSDADRLEGGDGGDLLIGGGGADRLIGGAGIDTASYAAANEGVDARLLGEGYAGDATGDTYAGVENLIGSGFGDVLFGDDQANKLSGGAGDDYLEGRGGNDRLIGGTGGDLLIGGLGADVFDFDFAGHSAPGARDIIRGDVFSTAFQGIGVGGGDVIDLSGIDANAGKSGNQAFVFSGTGLGRVSAVDVGGDTLIRGNADTDAAFEFGLLIEDGGARATDYSAGDFFL